VVDGSGLPIALSIAPGQPSDKATVSDLVERFFNKRKHFRCIAIRFDKLARNDLAAARLWVRAYESTT